MVGAGHRLSIGESAAVAGANTGDFSLNSNIQIFNLSGQTLNGSTPGADRFAMWDQSASGGAGALTYGTLGANLAFSGNTLVGTRPILLPSDFWTSHTFTHNNAVQGPFLGAAIASGTLQEAPNAAVLDGIHQPAVRLRSSTTANGGYLIKTGDDAGMVNAATSALKFVAVYSPTTAATATVRMGYLDNATITAPVDGMYFEIVGSTCTPKIRSNSTETTGPSSATLSGDVWYQFQITTTGTTGATFRVIESATNTTLLNLVVTATLPNTSARAFACGIVATESTTTATDIGHIHRLGFGTVAGWDKETQ
jgi:hypothetical protein